MLNKLINLIKEALRKMVAYKDVSQTINDVEMYNVSDAMTTAINNWKDIYKDNSSWLDEDAGIFSLGLGKLICQLMQAIVFSESSFKIITPGKESDEEEGVTTKAGFMNEQFTKHLLPTFAERIEQGMAVGGIIIKPYVAGNKIYFDFSLQGTFIPIAFDDEGNLTDVAFPDQFTAGNYIYTKLERQTFTTRTITLEDGTEQSQGIIVIQTKAFKAQVNKNEDAEQELGLEITLDQVDRWSFIEPVVLIESVDRPLFGYYRVPVANNIDLDSPLGVSVFSNAVKTIQRADEQFSRLDWEYEGGQIAIDVDRTAINYGEGYFGTRPIMDRTRERLYRGLDLGSDDTYKAFTPALRDANFIEGLNRYLMIIEDQVGFSRGTLSNVSDDARTATEIKMRKQTTFVTISNNQNALQKTLEDVVYAMSILTDLYELSDDGDYALNVEWSDSVLSDTDTELNQKIQLIDSGVLGKAEVRAWYTGEDLETAQAKVDEISQSNTDGLMNDIFSRGNFE